jgi:hypothetical protein
MYGKTSLYIFQMALPRVKTRFFFSFLFLRPFPAGCPGLIPGFYYYYYYYFAINRRSYSGYNIFKNKKYDEFSKTMQGRLIVTDGHGYPLV